MALRDLFEPLVFVEKRTIPDGLGGFETTYVETTEFPGSINLISTVEAKIAEQNGMKSIFTVAVDGNLPLEFRDIIKRKSTGEFFRITSNPDDEKVNTRMDGSIKSANAERFEMIQ